MVTGGGLKAIKSVLIYSFKMGPFKLWQTLRSKNACKACAFGTGGQNGGLKNESRSGIEICNKNIQAHLSDVRAGIPNQVFLERSIDDLSKLTGKELEDLGRISTPLYKRKGDRHYSPVSYEQALTITADRLKATKPERSFFYASGRSSNEAAFTLQLLARLYGTNNINNCSYYCHQASGVGLNTTVGTGTATIKYEDLSKADTIFVFGANPASNHPRFVKCLLKCRRRGGEVIIVNPTKEPGLVRFASPSDWRSMIKGGEAVASEYIQPHLGGDIAFMHGVIKAVLENGHEDKTFIAEHTLEFNDFAQAISECKWDDLIQTSGVEKADILRIAQKYSASKNAVIAWGMGMTHHLHGVANIESMAALALTRGMIGRAGAGLLPLRGHSNIQGTGSMGFTPKLKQAVESRLQQKLNVKLPTQAGLDTMACMEASSKGEMDVAFMLGGNLLASNPNTAFATKALDKIPFKCLINSTLNQSHVHGVNEEVVIFPIKVRDEETQPTTQESMFNFVRMSNGGINRFPQLKSEVELICELANQLISTDVIDFKIFRQHSTIRAFVGDIVEGFSSLKDIDESKEEFQIPGRTLHTPLFNTPTQRATFRFHPIKRQEAAGQFMLTTVRSEGQFNSIVFDERDVYREQESRQVVLMSKQDIKRSNLREGQFVTLKSETGELPNLKVKTFDIRPGNILTYYPEGNVLISNAVDSRSQTPAFKSTLVSIHT